MRGFLLSPETNPVFRDGGPSCRSKERNDEGGGTARCVMIDWDLAV
jgi:hypothetical protein